MSPTHLDPTTWRQATLAHVKKIFEEFSHERLVTPRRNGAFYELEIAETSIRYSFRARRYGLNHWSIDPNSIEKTCDGQSLALDTARLVLELQPLLQMTEDVLLVYLEELNSTLSSFAYKLQHQSKNAAELASSSFQEVERAMTAGHPCFVAGSGKIGFDTQDFLRFSPEAATPLSLIWLAAKRPSCRFQCIDELEEDTFWESELGRHKLLEFRAKLEQKSLPVDEYRFIPVHPWQWENKIAPIFADEVAENNLVYLGTSDDSYQPQQSIRTWFNRTKQERCYVKTALSILNMGFMRGLSPEYMEKTPAINQWVDAVLKRDPYFLGCGFSILREVASVGYTHPIFGHTGDSTSPYRKMLAALWRESPNARIREGQTVMTMAALLHHDREGRPLLLELIRRSGVSAQGFIEDYLRAYLAPLLHAFFAYEMVFMPHGENVILIFEKGRIVGTFLKDIAEEVAVFGKKEGAPKAIERIFVDVPEDIQPLSIFTDVFDCFFRFLVPILDQSGTMKEEAFWRLVAECIHEYQSQHPDLRGRFEQHDLFREEFRLSCLNRLQLRNNERLIDLADPARALQFAGNLKNPLHPFRSRKTSPEAQRVSSSHRS